MNLGKESLRVFVTVLETGSFSAAARVLKRAPSAVSMAIANMEAELNLSLFDRTGREPQPTPQALSLGIQAKEVLQQLQQWEAHALSLSLGLESKLSFAIEPELLSIDWMSMLAALAQKFPELAVEIVTAPHEDAMEMLHQGRVQLALLFERVQFDGREGFQELMREKLIAVISPEHPVLQDQQKITQTDLAHLRQIVVASRNQPEVLPRLLWSHQFWRTDNHLAALNLVLSGVGWALLPQTFVAPYFTQQRLSQLKVDSFNLEFPLCVDLVWSKQNPRGLAAQYVIDWVKQHLHSK